MFTLVLVVALNGLPYQRLTVDGFKSMKLCEEAKAVVRKELEPADIYSLTCKPSGTRI